MTAIQFQSATTQLARLRQREISAVELLNTHLAHIAKHNPAINAVVVLDAERALQRAREADAAQAQGQSWGPLQGLPVTVKEAFNITGLPTTWGFEAMRGNIAHSNAFVVQKLLDAGAIVFGKTNLPVAMADWQTFNPIYGTTNNPWDVSRGPGGSSGGSAAALAAGMSALEVGSDIGASIRNPAHYCGVYGHKPTWGVVSQQGHELPGEECADAVDIGAVGPMARSAFDLSLAMDVLCSPLSTMSQLGRIPAAWRDNGRAARDMRVGVIYDDPHAEVDASVQRSLRELVVFLRAQGVQVTEDARPVDSAETHRTYVRILRAATGAMADDAGFAQALQAAAGLKPEDDSYAARHWRGMTSSHREWVQADEVRWRLRRQWATYFERYDVLICPTATSAAFKHNQQGFRWERMIPVNGKPQATTDQLFWAGYTNLCGLPSTVVPLGLSPEGLPIGAQVTGAVFTDPMTLRFARWLETEFRGYVAPPALKG